MLVLIASTTGCFGNTTTEFPPGLEPLEEVTASLPEPDAQGQWPETINFRSGHRGDLYWTHAAAYIHAPISLVWTAMQDPEVVVDRRAVAEYTWDYNVEDGYDVSFVVHDVVHNIITVRFDVTWRESVVEGMREEPRLVAMRFEKTYGTTTIKLMRASIQLREAEEPDVTVLLMAEHLDAVLASNELIESQARDLHASIVARLNGLPLPTY